MVCPPDWEDSQGCTQPWFSGTVGSGLSTCTGRAGHAGPSHGASSQGGAVVGLEGRNSGPERPIWLVDLIP